MSPLISPAELYAQLDHPNLILLDASVADVVGCPAKQYEVAQRLPKSRWMNLDRDFVDLNSPLPHTLPSVSQFTHAAQRLAIDHESHVVVYDDQGVYSAARAWWLFHMVGHHQVQVLNGGLPAWLKAGYSTIVVDDHWKNAAWQGAYGIGELTVTLDPKCHVDCQHVLNVLADHRAVVIDVRAKARFDGEAAEPRPGMRSGHMPGAVNLPFTELLDEEGLKPLASLNQRFAQFELAAQQPLIFTCGSGMTACIGILAAQVCGFHHCQLYDGSWCEWGGSADLPVVCRIPDSAYME